MTSKEYKKYSEIIRKYAYSKYPMMLREPAGKLKHKFIVPGSVYSDSLWDWDSWLTNIAIRQILADKGEENSFIEYEYGCIMNFLNYTRESGCTPHLLTPTRNTIDEAPEFTTNMHKPVLAQHAAFVIENSEEYEWIKPYYNKLSAFVKSYIENCRHTNGLYFWLDDAGIGVDNDPCTFYRPDKSSASVLLNCFMYMELKAMTYIAEKLDIINEKILFQKEADHLKNAINQFCWDEKDGFYYSVDLNLLPIDLDSPLHCGAPRHWDCLIQRIGVWSGMLPLWAGIASAEQAERVVKGNYLDSRTFYAPYGIRTLSKLEKMYAIRKTGNPSCWLGPIWGISNYLTFRALVNYGYEEEAKELVLKTVELFGKDIETNGELHEYYDPESGVGVNNPGFQNWNFLVLNMMAWYEKRKVLTEFIALN